jgi:hypothetical protein
MIMVLVHRQLALGKGSLRLAWELSYENGMAARRAAIWSQDAHRAVVLRK